MFHDDYDFAVRFLTSDDDVFEIKEVSGNGLVLKLYNPRTNNFKMQANKEDVEKMIFLLSESLEYIKENE